MTISSPSPRATTAAMVCVPVVAEREAFARFRAAVVHRTTGLLVGVADVTHVNPEAGVFVRV